VFRALVQARSPHRVRPKKPRVHGFEPGPQIRLRPPAQGANGAVVHDLARRSVGLAGIPDDPAPVSGDLRDHPCEILDRDLLAGPDVDQTARGVARHQEHARVTQVIGIHELPHRPARTPSDDLRRIGLFRLVEAAHQAGDNVAGVRIKVVADAVHVARHDRERVEPVLSAIGVAHDLSGDLGDRIGQVGRLQRAGQQGLFAKGLLGLFWIDAGGPQEQELARAMAPGGVDNVGLDQQVFTNEIRALRVIGQDAADLGGGHEDVCWRFRREKAVGRRPVGQIQVAVGPGQNGAEATALQRAKDRGPDQAAVAGDKYPRVCLHVLAPFHASGA